VELAGAAPIWDWVKITGMIRKEFPDMKVYYGTNFWQPIRMTHDGLIRFFCWWLGKERVLKIILSKMPQYMPEKEELLTPMADMLLACKLGHDFWSNFDSIGMSCYWYPSMQEPQNDPDKYYKKYKSWYVGYLTWIHYIDDTRIWSSIMGDRFIITEAGPLYNCPLARKATPEQVKAWWIATFRAFEDMGAETMDVWDEMPRGKGFLDTWKS